VDRLDESCCQSNPVLALSAVFSHFVFHYRNLDFGICRMLAENPAFHPAIKGWLQLYKVLHKFFIFLHDLARLGTTDRICGAGSAESSIL
jgi:hypothetical protein